jgi:hypothetical protein
MRFLIPALLFFFAFPSAFGMIVENGKTVVIDRPVFEDIYLAGGTLTVNAPIHGDIVAAGGTIYINDTVYGEVLVAGANVTVNGFVTGKVRCIAGTLRIVQRIDGDLVIAGGSLSLEHNATVLGSVLATGGNVVLNGVVRRDVRAACASLKVYDSVDGNIDCRGADIEINAPIGGTAILAAANQLDIGTAAAFYQDVDYWAPEMVDFGPSLKGAKAIRDDNLRPPANHWYFLGAVTVWNAFWYLGAAFAEVLLLQLLFGPLFRKAGNTVSGGTWRALGAGFLWIFGLPVGIVLLCFTAIGLPIAAVVLLGYIAVWILCPGLVAVVVANWLNSRGNREWSRWPLVFAGFGCSVLLRLLFSIPFVGWIAAAFVICLAFGSILVNIRWKKTAANSL